MKKTISVFAIGTAIGTAIGYLVRKAQDDGSFGKIRNSAGKFISRSKEKIKNIVKQEQDEDEN